MVRGLWGCGGEGPVGEGFGDGGTAREGGGAAGGRSLEGMGGKRGWTVAVLIR